MPKRDMVTMQSFDPQSAIEWKRELKLQEWGEDLLSIRLERKKQRSHDSYLGAATLRENTKSNF